MSAPRVAYMLHRFPGLTETFVAEEIRNMQHQGVDVILYSFLAPRKELVQPVSKELLSKVQYAPSPLSIPVIRAQAYFIFKTPAKYFGLLRTILGERAPYPAFLLKRLVIFLKAVWIARALEGTGVELIHTHFAWLPAIGALTASQLLGIPFTVTAHAYDIYSERNDLLGLTCRNADKVITISEANKQAILAMNPPTPPDKVEVLHCGIDLRFFKLEHDRKGQKILQITSVGSLIEKKGHEFLIRACAILKNQGKDFKCQIIGAGSLEASLKNLIHELGLEGQVELVGARDQAWVKQRLVETDIFILACTRDRTGERDGIPVSLMEAMAMEVPVVSTPVAGIPELIQDGKTGLLVPERDPQCLTQAISRLTQEASLRQQITEKALALVTSEYSIQENTRRLYRIFESVIPGRCS